MTDADGDDIPVGGLAFDREQDADHAEPVVIVEYLHIPAHKHVIRATGKSVAWHNREFDYPADAPVVDVVYKSALDEALPHWREIADDEATDDRDFMTNVWESLATTYSFPEPRLERFEDADADEQGGVHR